MSITVGYAGPDVRADVCITATPASSFSYKFTSTISPLYDQAIRAQIELVAAGFGHPALHLCCEDSGALPFTWSARLNAAFSVVLNQELHSSIPNPGSRTPGLRRTRLYVPGNTPKLIPNSPLFKPDVIILDLEESVHPQRKTEALALVSAANEQLDWTAVELMVRVNTGDQGVTDMTMLAQSGVSAFILPKVESAEQIASIDCHLNSLDSKVMLFPLIESALGVENAFQIATASPRITALSLGLEDYIADLGATRTESQTESAFARSRILNAARAAGVTPLASVFPNFNDLDAVRAYATVARESGYEGIGCIHPKQIQPTHEAFAPTAGALEEARAIVQAFEDASLDGSAVVGVNGKMVDQPTYQRALKVVKGAG